MSTYLVIQSLGLLLKNLLELMDVLFDGMDLCRQLIDDLLFRLDQLPLVLGGIRETAHLFPEMDDVCLSMTTTTTVMVMMT